jgi:hypothetical protein
MLVLARSNHREAVVQSSKSVSQELEASVERLVNRVAHWTPNRWEQACSDGGGTRAARVHALAQGLADATADAEGQPRRSVPRLDNDLALPDQLRVLAADASAANVQDEDLIALVRDTSAAL